MKTHNFIAILITLLCIGCSPEGQVYSDYDRTAMMEAYRTFGWTQDVLIEANNNPIYYNQLNDKRIKTAVAEQLEGKGYVYDEENPELLIHYHIILEDKTVLRTDPYGIYGPYWVRSEVSVYKYREGTLIIDLMDAATNNLVWRGWMNSFLKNENPERMDSQIKEAVMMIFTKYPYNAYKENEPIQ